ncbi:hypothetical protein KASIA_p037 [Shewanella phage vB_SspS_KASIA]|nr:hypothetical protein KASIA_p037 [Shewanella phage vB_SspS_KASIA]
MLEGYEMNDIAIMLQSVFELNMARINKLIEDYEFIDPNDDQQTRYTNAHIVCVLGELRGNLINDHIHILKTIKGE